MIHQRLLPLSLEPEPELETESELESEADATVAAGGTDFTQSLAAVDPVLSPVPELSGHCVHTSGPAIPLKVSAAHLVTATPEPVWPAAARQSSSASEAAGLPELAGQALHSDCPVAS